MHFGVSAQPLPCGRYMIALAEGAVKTGKIIKWRSKEIPISSLKRLVPSRINLIFSHIPAP